MRSAIVAAVALGLAGCGGGGGYPQEAIDRFVAECDAQPNTTGEQCRCVVDRLQATMPYEEFERADEALQDERAADDASLVKLQAAVEACR